MRVATSARMRLIAALPPDARPRERLATVGAEHLTDAELVALVLGSGTRGLGVTDVAEALLKSCGGLAGLALAAESELRHAVGVGPVRAGVLRAALELGRRAATSRPARGQRLAGASDVWTYFRARLAPLRIEEFWAVALDVRHRVQAEMCLARGSLTGVEVHPRDVFRPLIRAAAAAVIFCHNHPSGDPAPSRQDVELTTRLREVGELCGIPVVDHVVVGFEGFASLAERGWR
ncbi:MAG TPA: DNA repair protein RadC [Polyangia bacterium]|nr:DNA repair protein RadC [Polyangia bacterium]